MAMLVPPSNDERTLLLSFLAHQRQAVKAAAYGLTDEQAATAPTASSLSVAGLIKHLTFAERGWMCDIRQEPAAGIASYLEAFTMGPEETIAGLIAEYDVAAGETEAVIAAIDDLNQAVPVPRDAPWFPSDVDAWSVRWVLLHLIEETARHAGHADIVRECVDGATSGPLLAAVESWEPTDWLQPWTPELSVSSSFA